MAFAWHFYFCQFSHWLGLTRKCHSVQGKTGVNTISFSTEKDSGSYSHLEIAVQGLLLELAGSQGLRCLSCAYLKGATGLRERKAAPQVWELLSESSPTSAHSSAKKELTLKIQPCRWLYYCWGFIYVCIFISPTLLTFLFFLLWTTSSPSCSLSSFFWWSTLPNRTQGHEMKHEGFLPV